MRGLLSLVIFFTCFARAGEPYVRAVHLELDVVEGATLYEIHIKDLTSGAVQKYKVKDPMWSGKLSIGSYEMKVRSLDYRGVPGEWSTANNFDVGLEKAALLAPAAGAVIASKEDDTEGVAFKWKPVPSAEFYIVEVVSQDGGFKKSEKVGGDHCKLGVKIASHYNWKVTAYGQGGQKSESSSDFEVGAGLIEKPKIEKPESPFVRELHWAKPKQAEKYDVDISRRDPTTKKWEPVTSFKDVEKNSIDFDEKWPGGVYKVEVRAKAEHWQASKAAQVSFRVRDGDRSPAAEFASTIRDSSNRSNGWYGVLAYLITDVNYASYNYDTHSTLTAFNGIGGTGRVGGGFYKKDSDWGFLGIADLSGIDDTHGSFTYASLEASGVWRKNLGSQGEVRLLAGGYYKEYPIAIVNTTTFTVSEFKNAAAIGPHAGAEYWYSMTPRLGLQANLNLYEGIVDVKTPNGQAIDPTLSSEYGLSGSYRVTSQFTGLLGVTRRVDNLTFKSTTAGSSNSTTITGNYFSLLAEYNF